MNSFDSSLARLRLRVHSDPALQARLFEISDVDQFLSALSNLLGDDLACLDDKALRLAMQQGRKAWVERDLP